MNKTLLVVATNNAHKLQEIRAMLGAHFQIKGMAEMGFSEDIIEDADTFAGNALIKARTIAAKLNCDCIADDSGLVVEALNGEPGVFSARYAGEPKSDLRNLQLVLEKLGSETNRKAYFITALAYVHQGLDYVFDGRVSGTILKETKGVKGFGYDPIFIPDGFDRSFAEMSPEEKNVLSHRARAIEKFLEFVKAF